MHYHSKVWDWEDFLNVIERNLFMLTKAAFISLKYIKNASITT